MSELAQRRKEGGVSRHSMQEGREVGNKALYFRNQEIKLDWRAGCWVKDWQEVKTEEYAGADQKEPCGSS